MRTTRQWPLFFGIAGPPPVCHSFSYILVVSILYLVEKTRKSDLMEMMEMEIEMMIRDEFERSNVVLKNPPVCVQIT